MKKDFKAVYEKHLKDIQEYMYSPQHKKDVRTRFDSVSPFFMENWNPNVKPFAIPYEMKQLTRPQAIALGSDLHHLGGYDEHWKRFGELGSMEEVEEIITELMKSFPEDAGYFIRLGSRSPKDSFPGEQIKFRAMTAKEALHIMMGSMERIYDDLCDYMMADENPWVVIRPWIDIEPQREVRCFVEGGKFIGGAQYHYWGEEGLENARFFKTFYRQILDACHMASIKTMVLSGLESFTVDFVFLDDLFNPTIIEINPPLSMGITDPCKFLYEKNKEPHIVYATR